MAPRLLLMLIVGATASVALAADPPTKWYRGNTHTHSLWSDGNDFPDMIAKWYVDHDYDFLVLSDHNALSKGERWMKLSAITKRRNPKALDLYKAAFPDNWVETRGEGKALEVRLKTLDEVRKLFEQPGKFVMIEGQEITGAWGRAPVHINAVNTPELIKPQPGSSVRAVMRKAMQKVREQSERTGKPMFAHLNHPNFHWGVTAEDIAHVIEEPFFEVFNGHPSVRNRGDAHHASTERMWDIIATIRIAELKAPPVYGVATDDSHHYHEPDDRKHKSSIPGRGWVQVAAPELTADAVTASMIAGRFYASTGVALNSVEYNAKAGTLTIEIEPIDSAKYTTRFVGTTRGFDAKSEPVTDAKGKELRATRKYSDDVGRTLQTTEGVRAVYKFTGEELYVRAIVTSDRAPALPLDDKQVETAWTQPVGWQKWVKP